MMGRIYSSIAKFKRVEACFREGANAWPKVIKEIDEAKSGPRTKVDLETLEWLREQCLLLRKKSTELLGEFYDRVDAESTNR